MSHDQPPESLPSAVTVIVGDDDEATRIYLQGQLESFGHKVLAVVASGREAVEQARALAPDVILLDVHMPDGSGVEAAEQIAQDRPDLAVVLLSADAALQLSPDEVKRTTAVALLPKPVPPRVLDSTLRLAVFRARELRSARAEAAEMRRQLEARKTIERAKGILMRRTGLSEQEAYRILQRTSQDRSVPMQTVAKEVLDSEPSLAGRTK